MNYTKEEKTMLINGLEALLKNIRERKDKISDFIWAATDFGLIEQSGKGYEENIQFFEMKDKIKQKFENHEAEVIKLRNKLYKHDLQ